MLRYYCPSCWAEIAEGATSCPACSYDLSQFARLTYEEKLLLALKHPVREHRLMAIQVLGRLGSERALPDFRYLLETEHDFYLLREILRALTLIPGCASADLLHEARSHSSPLVRAVARQLPAARRV